MYCFPEKNSQVDRGRGQPLGGNTPPTRGKWTICQEANIGAVAGSYSHHETQWFRCYC